MSSYSKLPEDYPVDALALEVERRKKCMERPYSYGQLVADTTVEEREMIAEAYRASFRAGNRRGSTKSLFSEADREGAGE